MTNKLLLSTLIASSFFIASQANATDVTGHAKFTFITPISITEDVQMEFGNIDSVANDFCEINTSGVLNGASCIPGGASPLAGSFTVTGTDSTVNLAVVASGATVPGVVFAPALDAATQIISAGSATVKVGGRLTVTGAAATDGLKNLEYTLSVTY